MAWEFRPGMKVVCVKGDWTREVGPLEGHIYLIEEAVMYPKGHPVSLGRGAIEELECDVVFLRLNEFGDILWDGFSFRPVRTTDISSLLALLKTTPARQPVEA